MKKVTFPILHIPIENKVLESLDIETKIEDCEVRPVTFYHIAAISSYIEDGKEFTCIHANNQDFICPLKQYEIETEIDRNL